MVSNIKPQGGDFGLLDRNAFRRLPNQGLIDQETAQKNREARPTPENIYQPAAAFEPGAPIEGAPSIAEQARALKYNVDLIYQFVHDNIDFLPNYGLHKGGWGALVDGYGNAFDQADLMVQLLVASGYTASYVLGSIQLSAAQWSNLLNVSTSNIVYAANLLGNGGFAGSYSTVTNTIIIDYCWVQCVIGGTTYQFDPALKSYNYVSGINLASAMGYNRSTFLADAQSLATVTANSAQNINQPNISGDLSTYAMNLVNWINTNNSGATLEQILGGRSIVPVSGPVRNTTLPYQYGTSTVYSALPTSVIATVQIQYGSINQTFFTNQIYGYRMSIFWNASNQAQLYLNLPGHSGNIVATSAAQTIGQQYPLTFTITHPYATSFANGPATVNLTAGAYYALGTAWGYAGRQMADIHRVALTQSLNAGAATDAENVIGESLSITWWNFSGQNSSGTEIINQLSNSFSTFHHNIGVVAFYPSTVFSPGNSITVNFFANYWVTNTLSPTSQTNAASAHVGLLWHMLEAAVFAQTPGVPTASSPTVITSANGGSCSATIGGTPAAGNVVNIFVQDSRLSTNPTQVSYTVIAGDTTTTIATKLANLINGMTNLAAIGVTATSATNILRIGSYSYNNTTFTESTTGAVTVSLSSAPGTVIYSLNKTNWSTINPLLDSRYPPSMVGTQVASYNTATITGPVSSGGGDVLNIYVYDSGLTTNPALISYRTAAGDTTTNIATNLAAIINTPSSPLATLGITATSSGNVLTLSSLSPNITTYTQSVTSGSETIALTNFAFAAISGPVSSSGGDVLNIFVTNSALTTNPTQITYTTIAGDTPSTIALNLAALVNSNANLISNGISATADSNIVELNSASSHNTTYSASVTSGSETITLYYSDGTTAIIPQSARVYVSNYFYGYGYYLFNFDGSEFYGPLTGYAKGANSGDISDSECNSGCSGNSVSVNGNGNSSFSLYASFDPIDLFTGRYINESTDISVGSQSDPYQLSFVRTYNSGNFINNGPLGYGWNHNYQISAQQNSDGFIGFGYESVVAAAAVIAEMYVCQDILSSTSPFLPVANAVTICIANQWLMNQIANNTAVVQFGSTFQVFAKLPNGTYVPPLGVKTATSLAFGTTFTYTTPDKVVYSFNSAGQIATIGYPFGVTITFTYTSGQLTSVSNGYRTLTLSYSGTNLTGVSDGNGRSVNYTVTANQLTVFKDALSNSTTYSYAGLGLVSQIFRPANPTSPVVTNTYDTLNRVKTQADAYGNLWNYYFAGSRTEEDDPNNNSRVWFWDSFGSPIQYTDQLGNSWLGSFDGLERPTLVTLPEGNSSSYIYDQYSNLTSITTIPKPGSGLANITNSFTYDLAWNKIKTATDGNGNITQYTYSSVTGQLVTVQYPTVSAGTPISYFTYNSMGQLLTSTDPSGVVTAFSYNSATANPVNEVIDPGSGHLNLTSTYFLDAVGNVTGLQDPNGNTTTFMYDASRRLIQTAAPAPYGYITTYSYDANNNLVQIQRALGSGVVQTYSATFTLDDLTASILEPVINSWGQQVNPTTFSYDNLRRLHALTDATGNAYSYAYDAMSRIHQIIFPNGIVGDTRSYSPNSNLANLTDGNGNATIFTYDGFDRLSNSAYPDTTTEVYGYDANNNITLATTRNTSTIGFTYDALNQLLTKSPQGEATVNYAYDLAGRIVSASTPSIPGDPSTGNFQMFYDSAGRFNKEEYPDGLTVTIGLDQNGNINAITYPDGTLITRKYDQLDRLISVSDAFGSARLAYDTLSRRVTQTYGNGLSCGYFYDLGNNLIALTVNKPSVQFSYAYNAIHQEAVRRATNNSYIWQPFSSQTTAYGASNNLNQYPSVAGNTYTYNSDGCLTGDGNLTYGYDAENRLTSVSGAGLAAVYAYDPLGRQSTKTVNSVMTRFLYSGIERIADYNNSGAVLDRYVFGESLDEPLWVETTNGSITYLTADRTGSIILATDFQGNVIAQTTYDPFGNTSTTPMNYGFAGQRYDTESKLYYFNARHYSPSLGRFLQPDPSGYFGGTLNLYGYVNNDPCNLFDPLGLAIGDGGGGGGSGGGYMDLSAVFPDVQTSSSYSPWSASASANNLASSVNIQSPQMNLGQSLVKNGDAFWKTYQDPWFWLNAGLSFLPSIRYAAGAAETYFAVKTAQTLTTDAYQAVRVANSTATAQRIGQLTHTAVNTAIKSSPPSALKAGGIIYKAQKVAKFGRASKGGAEVDALVVSRVAGNMATIEIKTGASVMRNAQRLRIMRNAPKIKTWWGQEDAPVFQVKPR